MQSLLIKDTTRAQREEIVRRALSACGSPCDGCNGRGNAGAITALQALDATRRILEGLERVGCGDAEVDEAISDVADENEHSITALAMMRQECV